MARSGRKAHADRAGGTGADTVAAADALGAVDVFMRLDAHAAGRGALFAADASSLFHLAAIE